MRRLILTAAFLTSLAAPVAAQTGADGDTLVLSGPGGQLRVVGYEVDVDQVRFSEAGVTILSGATLTRPGRDGHVLIRQVEIPETGLLARILTPISECDPTEAASGAILAREVRFRPDSDLGVPGGREEIRVPVMEIEMSRIGCSWRMTGVADGVVISGVDGSRIDIDTVETRMRLSGRSLEEVDARVDLIGMALTGADRPGGLMSEEVGFSFSGDLSDDGIFSLIRSDAPLKDLISAASDSVTRFGFYVRGFEMVPDLFLPERDLTRLGIAGYPPISGDAEIAASMEFGSFRVRGASDLSGIVRGELDLSGSLPQPGGVSVPDAIAGSVPVPAELIGVSLERATIRYEDLGADGVIEHLTGRPVATLATDLIGSRVDRVSGRLPGGLPATVAAAWDGILGILRDGSGSAGLRPEQPFSLIELAVSGMMGPTMAASRTGAWREN
jgi:hypothetical protein